MIWRLVAFEKIATLQEIETHWSLEDVFDAHDVLNFRDEQRALEIKRAKEKSSGGLYYDR